MANRNMIIGLLRGLFAALVAMSVVISSSAHASAFAGHRVIASPVDDHMMHAGGDRQDDLAKKNGQLPNLKAPESKTTSAKKSHGDNRSLCKMQCDFSMIAAIPVPTLGAPQRVQIFPSWHVAFLPSDARADIRPPRS